jgi:hypothetical protein
MGHQWHFFRAGGVDQVSLRDGTDLTSLRELDQQLWVALAMPTTGTDVDPDTLALLDPDKDGRVRVDDILGAVDWIAATFKQPGDLLTSADSIALDALADAKVVAAARRMLTDLGKPEQTTISVAEVAAIAAAFSTTVLNGDGIVIPASATDPELARVITEIIACEGSAIDRSGKPGIDKPRADAFFADIDLLAKWLEAGDELGSLTDAADAVAHVRGKLDDYFARCTIAAFDPRGATSLDAQDADLLALNAHELTEHDANLAKLPLARIAPSATLSLHNGLNPAWAGRITTFVERAVTPLLGARDSLTRADFAAIVDKLAAYDSWRTSKPTTTVAALDHEWIESLAATPDLRAKLDALIAADSALAPEYDQIASVTKAVRLRRDFGRIVRNFVNFSDFYARQDGVFQAGTLYLDARAFHLCILVSDAAKHALLAGSSDACLVYCDLKRGAETRQVACAVTNGDADNIFVGRNGIFYDRKGDDWDATIAKVINNPIGIRQAFWSPYKKLVRVIEDNVTKRAAAADAEAQAKLEAAAAKEDGTPAPAAAPAEPKGIDIGTVAALGVAIGGIGTLFGALLGNMFNLGPYLPIGILVLMLMISTPAMLLAWLKLRRRNLGPILDANGWAINGRARINVAFGARMTELAVLPKDSQRSLDDPFADKRTPWKRWVVLAVLVVLGFVWFFGKLDEHIPDAVSSVSILGKHAPLYKKQKAIADAKAAADKVITDKAAADAKTAADAKAAADKAAAEAKAAADTKAAAPSSCCGSCCAPSVAPVPAKAPTPAPAPAVAPGPVAPKT